MRTPRIALFVMVLAGPPSAVGCGKESSTNETPAPSAEPSASAPALAPEPVEESKPVPHVELAIASVANVMAYDKTALSVPTGAEVHLTLKNNATLSTLPHDWVLVKPGTEARVALAGLKYGEKAGYIDINDSDMLVHAPLAKPGETSDVTFIAPEPGTYPYICTTPGHYMMMKGVLTVTP